MQIERNQTNTKSTLKSIYADLDQHSQFTRRLFSGPQPVRNPYLKGHFEAHFEKIDDMKFELKQVAGIEGALQVLGNAEKMEYPAKPIAHITEKQALKLLHRNIKSLIARVRGMLNEGSQKFDRLTLSRLQELQRKLGNDLFRTAYLLQ